MPTIDDYAFAAISRTRNRLFRECNEPIRANGLTMTQFEVLEALSAHGQLSMGAVQDAIYGTQGNVPVAIRNLQKLGLVSIGRSELDARVRVVSLTDEGTRRVEAVYPQVMDRIGDILSSLSHDEKRQLIRLLHKALRKERGSK